VEGQTLPIVRHGIACRQLNDLPDELAAKITIHYYLDARDALLKALAV
jgi:hypothetical protein